VVRRTLVAITPAHCVDALLVGPDGLTGLLMCIFIAFAVEQRGPLPR
jgi:hypothetical protein